eukprot:scaffold22208_cov65-Phaeocystis_antarctica.AAC.2
MAWADRPVSRCARLLHRSRPAPRPACIVPATACRRSTACHRLTLKLLAFNASVINISHAFNIELPPRRPRDNMAMVATVGDEAAETQQHSFTEEDVAQLHEKVRELVQQRFTDEDQREYQPKWARAGGDLCLRGRHLRRLPEGHRRGGGHWGVQAMQLVGLRRVQGL